MPRSRLFFLVLLVTIYQSSVSGAMVKFDFEQKYFTEPGQPVLDHTVVEENGLYHLFYLRGNPAVDIGHATSTDFIRWTTEPPVLETGTWDNLAMWAPYIYKSGNLHFLFYTGVNTAFSQQSGLAFSADLYSWSKLPWPVYHPDPVWAEWSTEYWTHGRDPHVIEHDGAYYMFLTAKTTDGYGAVACGMSTDLITWQDIGPLYVHYTWHVMESVFILKRNNTFHMFFTEEQVLGTSHMPSPDLFSGWDISNRRLIDTGHAPEITPTSDGREIFSRYSIHNDQNGGLLYAIRFDELGWFNDVPAPLKPWPLADNWTVIQGTAFPYQPVFENNPYARGVDVPKTFEGHGWIGTMERYTGPMGYGYAGATQGEDRTGIMHSRTFSLTGNSMNLLVGGGNFPDECYVALVDNNTGEMLFKETGSDSEAMDRRYWDTRTHIGTTVYVEIADLSLVSHINVDDILESGELLSYPDGNGDGNNKHRPSRGLIAAQSPATIRLHQNAPNPFNPTTSISYELDSPGEVVLEVYDIAGSTVRRLETGRRPAGTHVITWDGTSEAGHTVTSGVYFYRLVVDGALVATRKMTMLK